MLSVEIPIGFPLQVNIPLLLEISPSLTISLISYWYLASSRFSITAYIFSAASLDDLAKSFNFLRSFCFSTLGTVIYFSILYSNPNLESINLNFSRLIDCGPPSKESFPYKLVNVIFFI